MNLLPLITSISNKIIVSRSRNIRFYMVLQDFDKLKKTYKESTSNIKSNCTKMRQKRLMLDELKRFNFGVSLFTKTRINPVKTKIKSIREYSIKFEISTFLVPKKLKLHILI